MLLQYRCVNSSSFNAFQSYDLLLLQRPSSSATSQKPPSNTARDALLVISTYNRLTWGNYIARTYQHAVLGSQTIGDLYEAMPCPAIEIPPEIEAADTLACYKDGEIAPHKGAVICLEGICYGDGQSEEDYSQSVPLTHDCTISDFSEQEASQAFRRHFGGETAQTRTRL